MQTSQIEKDASIRRGAAENTVLTILLATSFSHLLNDTIQSLIPAIYPLLKHDLTLTFTQLGMITLTFQMTASILQPFIGLYTDRRPLPYSLALGMGTTLVGLILLSRAESFSSVLLTAALVGVGSAVFHPEASRIARLASGGRHGLAQSLFQVGGHAGTAFGPLLAALIVVPHGRGSVLWFSLVPLSGILVLSAVGRWYQQNLFRTRGSARASRPSANAPWATRRVLCALAILILLVFSKYFYLASITNYYTFYLIDKFHLSVGSAQIHLFVFLFAVAAGTIIGGPVGDRIGRKTVIWISILGVAPFTLLLPFANLFWTGVLSVLVGVILASAFSAIVVYAQELVPGRVGMIAGIFFGLAFGVAGIGSALLGSLADHTSVEYVFRLCSFLPLLGLLTGFLPKIEPAKIPS